MYAQAPSKHGNAKRIPHLLPPRLYRPNREPKRPALWYPSENGQNIEYFSTILDKVKYSQSYRYVH